jgi:hypothetical protein
MRAKAAVIAATFLIAIPATLPGSCRMKRPPRRPPRRARQRLKKLEISRGAAPFPGTGVDYRQYLSPRQRGLLRRTVA